VTKLIKNVLTAAVIATASIGYATTAMAGHQAVEAIAAAKMAQKKAASVGGEWRDTGKMIKKAEKLLADNKWEDAAKLAKKAEAQGMLGHAQSMHQAGDNLHIN